MKPQDSRPVSELSKEESAEYFPPPVQPKQIYPDPEFCKLHDVWFIGKCYQCIYQANLTVESFEECNLGYPLPMPDKIRNQKKTVKLLVPHVGYQYQNFLAENQK